MTPKIEKSEYDIQAESFLHETETTIEKKFLTFDSHAVCEEWKNVQMIWTDLEIEQLAEIQ